MSRIGKHPVAIPAGVTVTITPDSVTVKGPKGELTQQIKEVTVKQEGDQIIVERPEHNDKLAHSLYGTYRALIANMVHGVSEGFTKQRTGRRGLPCFQPGTETRSGVGLLAQRGDRTSRRDQSRDRFRKGTEPHRKTLLARQGTPGQGMCQDPFVAQAGALQRKGYQVCG